MSRRMLLIAAAPALLLGVVRVLFLVAALWDVHPFWLWQPLNLAEAAALRDRGEVSRLLAEGQDPSRTYRVRRGFLRDHAVDTTPMKAALSARRDEIVQILLDAGVAPEPAKESVP